ATFVPRYFCTSASVGTSRVPLWLSFAHSVIAWSINASRPVQAFRIVGRVKYHVVLAKIQTVAAAIMRRLRNRRTRSRKVGFHVAPPAAGPPDMTGAYSFIASGSTPTSLHHFRYANGEISLGLISLRPPQKTFV